MSHDRQNLDDTRVVNLSSERFLRRVGVRQIGKFLYYTGVSRQVCLIPDSPAVSIKGEGELEQLTILPYPDDMSLSFSSYTQYKIETNTNVMVDWFVAWGVSSLTGFVFRDVLMPLAKGTLEDYTKDFLKDCIRDFSGLFENDTLNTVVGKAVKEFLVLVQQELEDAEVSQVEVEEYSPALTKFIHNSSVKGILGSGFQDECSSLDTQGLGNLWYQLNLRSLPEDFDWEQVGKRYLRKVKALIRESPELRQILDSQKLEAIARYTQESAGIIPEFDLRRYQEGLREAYGNLRLDSLDTTGCAYNALKLWRIFIAQNVRKVHEALPQMYELPKEHQWRSRETDQFNPDFQFGEFERYQRVYSDAPIQSVLDVINDKRNYPYLVILGDPGSGKSTLLQYLALIYAQSPLQNAISLAIPILIELRTYMRNRDLGQCQNFLEFLHQSSGAICHLNQHQLQEQLKAGKVLMLFDGLDEVFDPGKREDVITDIHRFTNEYPDVQVIVTSRVIGYKLEEVKNRQGIVAVDKQLLERLKELIHYSYTIPVYFFSQRDYEHNRFVKETRTQAITQIATTWKDNPQTLAWLKQRVQSDDSDDVRHAAVQELAQGWKDEPDTLPFLKQLVQSPDNFVRHAAVRELAQGWKEDPILYLCSNKEFNLIRIGTCDVQQYRN